MGTDFKDITALVKAYYDLGTSTTDMVEALKSFQQYTYSCAGSPTLIKTEKPNCKEVLEIFPQIVVSEEFHNLKIDN